MSSAILLYNNGQSLRERFEQQFGSDVLPMVKTDMLVDFRDKPDDMDLFRAFISIKSLIGIDNFTLTTKDAIISRMVGCKTKKSFQYFIEHADNKKEELLPTVEKYKKRDQMKNLFRTLIEKEFIMSLSKQGLNKIYFSTYMEPEQLEKLILDNRKGKLTMEQRRKDASERL